MSASEVAKDLGLLDPTQNGDYVFSGMAVNGTPASSEPLTLERLKEINLQLTAALPKTEDLCPNPADVHPETFSALLEMAFQYDVANSTYLTPHAKPIHGVTLHVRTDVTPGVFHPCTCKKENHPA